MSEELPFICSHCHGRFFSSWSDEDARAEMRENWGDLDRHDRAIVCDDCYQSFMRWAESQGLVGTEGT